MEADNRSRSAMLKNLKRMVSSEASFEERYADRLCGAI